MTMLVLPTWVITGMTRAEHAKAAIDGSNIVISEVAVGIGDSNNEFVELYNPTERDIELSQNNLALTYIDSNNVPHPKPLTFNTNKILSHGYFLLVAGNVNVDADAVFTKALTNNGGVIVSSYNTLTNGWDKLDSVAWGIPVSAITAVENIGVNVSLNTDKSIERLVDNQAGNYVDTDDNSKDFYLQDLPNPQSSTATDSTDLFTRIANETKIKLDPTSVTSVGVGGELDLKFSVQYPKNLIEKVKDEYKIDAQFSLSKTITSGTSFILYNNSVMLGTYTFTSDLLANNPLWLSDIVEEINPLLPTRGPLNAEPESANWEIKIPNLSPENIYNLNLDAVTSKDFTSDIYVLGSMNADLIVDLSVETPVDVQASKTGSDIRVEWPSVVDNLSGLAGYNLYSNIDGFLLPTNSSLIQENYYSILNPADGKYTYKVEAVDKVGNVSEKSVVSNEVIVDSTKPTAPNVLVSSKSDSSGKYIHIEWVGVGGYVDKYEVFVNDVTSSGNTVLVNNNQNDLGVVYSKDVNVASYGNYRVYIKVWKGSEFVLSETRTAQFVEPEVLTTATVTTVVAEPAPVPEATIEAPKAVAAEKSVPTETDDEGIIKGDEESDTESSTKINWTPWIVLFCLIILAGAATGGYFYWFNGEEEVNAVVRESKKQSVAPKQTKEKVIPKNVKNNKKSKRW